MRYLMVRLSSIGDIVHVLPAAAALAESFPQAEIHWAIEKRYAVLLEGNPHLARVIVLDTLRWRESWAARATWTDFRQALSALRRTSYDVAIDFQGLWKSAVVAWLSGARERLGFAAGSLREPGAALFYTRHAAPSPGVHVVAENLALVERLGARAQQWQFPLPHRPEDDTYVDRQLATLGAEDFIIINPGGGWRSKCWPPEHYAALMRQLSSQHEILLTGSRAEEALLAGILESAGTPRARYMPATLTQFIALARRARLFIGGDTGPLHLAAAVGTPIVGIYGPTDPARNGPFAAGDVVLANGGPRSHSRRGPECFLSGVRVESIVAAVAQRLGRNSG